MHELGTMLANEPVRIRHGRKIVEITPEQVSKGDAVRRLLSEKQYNVTLCAGDDQTDESMFEIETTGFVSIKVGSGPSRARFRLRDPAAFRQFLTQVFFADVAEETRVGVP
jgi:trehalose-phosphatase